MVIRLVVQNKGDGYAKSVCGIEVGSVKQEMDQRPGQVVLDKLKHLEPHQIAVAETGVTAQHWSVRGGQKGAVEEQVSGHK